LRHSFFVLIILFLTKAGWVFAGQDTNIEKLLDELKVSSSQMEASQIRTEIWQFWVKGFSRKEISDKVKIALDFFYSQNYENAEGAFSEIIALDPAYVEGWNKRATVRYLLGDFENSLKDIEEVLKRQPRHFGAISGAALIHMQNKDFEKALNRYRFLKRIDPNNIDSARLIPVLEDKVLGKNL
jgi:tetratricopeptide (TPR) repeat protein